MYNVMLHTYGSAQERAAKLLSYMYNALLHTYVNINIHVHIYIHTHAHTCMHAYLYVLQRKELEDKLQRAERDAENATADALKMRQDKLRAETRARELEEGKTKTENKNNF